VILAVLGGSFDPVHVGHVAMAREALSRGLADRVLVIPNWHSPHKTGAEADAVQRLEMVRLAFGGLEGVRIDGRELAAGRAVATVETLMELTAENPSDELVLLLGADHVAAFPRWRRPDRVQDLARIVIFARRGWSLDASALKAAGLRDDRVSTVPDFDLPVSSSDVRAMLAATEPDLSVLPAPVAEYVRRHGLYGSA
jgi:nicotinate-nucleotide adenylyltransferase